MYVALNINVHLHACKMHVRAHVHVHVSVIQSICTNVSVCSMHII